MTTEFNPNLCILPPAQRQLWNELIDVPPDFVLYGGTAIALHLGRRASVDFDFFGARSFDPDQLYREISFLDDSEVIQKGKDTLICVVERGGPVQVSFFGIPGLKRIQEPLKARDNGLNLNSAVGWWRPGSVAAFCNRR